MMANNHNSIGSIGLPTFNLHTEEMIFTNLLTWSIYCKHISVLPTEITVYNCGLLKIISAGVVIFMS